MSMTPEELRQANNEQNTTELILNTVKNKMDYINPKMPGYRTIHLPYPKDGWDLYYFYLGKINGKLVDLDDFN